MPQPRIKKSRFYATDHRALVLESVATSPRPATLASITADCHGSDAAFTAKQVGAMVWWLHRVGLIAKDEQGGFFITKTGLDWMTFGRFDRALPAAHTRPGARKPRKRS